MKNITIETSKEGRKEKVRYLKIEILETHVIFLNMLVLPAKGERSCILTTASDFVPVPTYPNIPGLPEACWKVLGQGTRAPALPAEHPACKAAEAEPHTTRSFNSTVE